MENQPDDETQTPAGFLALLEEHRDALWGAIDSEHNPLLLPMKTTTRERIVAALKAHHDLTALMLRRYFEQ